MGKCEGRPPKAIKQEKNIGFFVTKKQYFIIRQKAAEAGVNISDYMRQAAIYAQIKVRWREEDRKLFKEMVGMSNDLHRLTEMAQKEGVLNAMLYFKKYRDRIDEIIKEFSHAQ